MDLLSHQASCGTGVRFYKFGRWFCIFDDWPAYTDYAMSPQGDQLFGAEIQVIYGNLI
jgi:hypothetical protein